MRPFIRDPVIWACSTLVVYFCGQAQQEIEIYICHTDFADVSTLSATRTRYL